MRARIQIMPKDGILDPQGVTVNKALKNLGIKGIDSIRMGKFIEIDLPKLTKDKAEKVTTEACEKLLVNSNVEGYKFEIIEGS